MRRKKWRVSQSTHVISIHFPFIFYCLFIYYYYCLLFLLQFAVILHLGSMRSANLYNKFVFVDAVNGWCVVDVQDIYLCIAIQL